MANSLSQEEINFLRLAGLLIRVAPRAVRQKFDDEFHPVQLHQFLSRNRRKIDDLTFKKRVITQLQYDLLYPRGYSGVSSESFDVSLMVCLLRHFTDLDIQDSLPLEHIHLPEADISRIKFYRNYIVHSDCGTVTDVKFLEIRNCLVEAIGRLSSDLKPDIDRLMSSPLTNVRDVKDFLHIEKELENTNQRLKTMAHKLESLDIENINFEEIRQRTLNEWRNTDKKYVTTSATKFLLQSLKHNNGVIITGSPGCGKSVVAHHVALELEKEGYDIIPCDDPSEILRLFTKEKVQVFVINDVCGKFALNQHKADSWEENNGKLNILTEPCTLKNDNEETSSKSRVKFIITCRENIYVHRAFPKLTCFSLVHCNFSTNYKISQDEMKKIALSYVSEETVNSIQNICLYDFFPLICALYCKNVNRDPRFFTHPVEIIEKEISVMKVKSETSFLCLSLLVLRNNKISTDDLRSGEVEQLLKDICKDCAIESTVSTVSIQNCFERLKGIYIIEAEEMYTAIHDKMFDIIAAAIAPSIMECLIKYANIAFLATRIQLLSFGRSSLLFAVHIPHEFERNYLKRIYKEVLRGKYWEVFGSIQTENEAYRKLLLSFLKEQETCQQTSYVPDDDESTPLFVSSSLGYLDFVEYFIAKCHHHIEVKDKKGRSPFYVACKNGHIAVVKYLLKYYEDVNAEDASDTTALSATCLNGHTEVVQLLLDNNADISRTNNSNQNALYFACLNGNFQLVNVLFSAYNPDTTIRDTEEKKELHTACRKEYSQASEKMKVFWKDVNQQSDVGCTPLLIACHKGHYETVKLLLDLNGQTLNSFVDTTTKEDHGLTALHAACHQGHTEVVKLLIKFGLNINDTSYESATPLYFACQDGHYDTVKFLLGLNNRVDILIKHKVGWSVLHVACARGHIEVIKLLIEAGMNVNNETKTGFTPLMVACWNGQSTTVKHLLHLNGKKMNSCVDTTTKDKKGWSALHIACSKGHTEVVRSLVDVGMNVNDTNNDRLTPFYLACISGHYDTVKFLLALNSQTVNNRVDTTTEHECVGSVLHAACFYGHTEVVKLLVDVGMSVNEASKGDCTPFYLACQNGHYDTVKCLMYSKSKTNKSHVDTMIKKADGWSVLHAACWGGHTELVKLLIDVGLNTNDTTNKGYTPLYLACHNGYYKIVKYLLDLNGQTINSRVDTAINNAAGWSVMHVVCHKGHTEIVKLLIDVSLNINATSNEGFTPLYLASMEGRYDTVKFLLELDSQTLITNRVDTLIKIKDGWSALHVACFRGHVKVVKLLIEVGMNVNDKTNDGFTPLLFACLNGHSETVKFLLDLNGQSLNSCVDTTTKVKNEGSALHAACSNGHTEVVRSLVDVGMSVNDTNNNRLTPLHLACVNGQYDTVKFLLALNGQTVDSRVCTATKNGNGWSALHTACSRGHTDTVKLLIDVGMNINDTTDKRYSPLYLACQYGHYDTVKYLINLNSRTLTVDTNIKTEDEFSDLRAAFPGRQYDILTSLLASYRQTLDTDETLYNEGVYTATKDGGGWSALHAACSGGHTEIVKLLVDVGMNINDTTNKGYSPLYLACQYGHYDTVKYLITLKSERFEKAVDATIKTLDGLSVLHAACSGGHTEIVKLLIDVGLNLVETSNEGFTPLYLACQDDHYDTVKFLLDFIGQTVTSRVDMFKKNKVGWSALHVVCFCGHIKVVKLLIKVGMDVNDKTNNGLTLLLLACHNGHSETVKFLLDLKEQKIKGFVDITKDNIKGWSALHISCSKGHTEVVRSLVDVGMNVNDTNNDRLTPLHLACGRGQYDTVEFLLALNGQTLDSRVCTATKDKRGWSVLHSACSNGHTKVVKLLIDIGMNMNDATNKEETPLYLACHYSHYDTMKCLIHLNGETSEGPVDTTKKNIDGLSVLHAACSGGNTEIIKLLIGVGLNTNSRTFRGFTPLHQACLNGHADAVRYLLSITDKALKVEIETMDYLAAKVNGHVEVMKILSDHMGKGLCVIL